MKTFLICVALIGMGWGQGERGNQLRRPYLEKKADPVLNSYIEQHCRVIGVNIAVYRGGVLAIDAQSNDGTMTLKGQIKCDQ